jgi:hypothetical protein
MATIDELKGIASAKLGFARNNNFLVELPNLGVRGGLAGLLGGFAGFLPSIPGITGDAPQSGSRELNVLCESVTMPGRQILTSERRIGNVVEKVGYGYAVDDVSMTFYLMNDYGVKNYFDAWMNTVFNNETYEPGYKKDYAKSVKIHQLRKPIVGLSQGIGPIRINLGVGAGSVYSVELEEAFPTTMQQIDFTNEQDGIVRVTVQLSFTNWKRISPSQNFITLDINPGQLFG